MRSLESTIEIKAGSQSKISLRELWLYRELFYFFAWRDIKVRYKQTVIGVAWAVIQPLIATLIFTLLFNHIAGIKAAGNLPYPVFAYLGLMYWNAFASAISTVSNSLLNNQGVLTKIYFPRLIPPLSAVMVSIVDFFFAGIVFIGLMIFYRTFPDLLGVFPALFALVLMMVFATGLGLYFAALNVKYRDVKAALPFIVQIMFYTTPVILPVEMIPARFQFWVYLNPAAGALDSVRAGLFHTSLNLAGVAMSTVIALLLLAFGLWYFKRTEKKFVDII